MKSKAILLTLFMTFGALFARNIDEATGWEYDQSTLQAFYMFEAITVDGEDVLIMGQQEVLAVIGSLLLSRICGLWYPYRAEDQGRCFFRHIACEIIRERLERFDASDKLINSTAGISNRNNDGTVLSE